MIDQLFKFLSKQNSVSKLEKVRAYQSKMEDILFVYDKKYYGICYEFSRIHYNDYIKKTTKELFETDKCINFDSIESMEDYVYGLFKTKTQTKYKQISIFDEE